jgi:integrase
MWLSAVDPQTEVPPPRALTAGRRRRRPHIFSDAEIGRLMAEAAHRRSRTGLRPLTYATLIGLLASTGVRPGEALALDRADVDLEQGVLTRVGNIMPLLGPPEDGGVSDVLGQETPPDEIVRRLRALAGASGRRSP